MIAYVPVDNEKSHLLHNQDNFFTRIFTSVLSSRLRIRSWHHGLSLDDTEPEFVYSPLYITNCDEIWNYFVCHSIYKCHNLLLDPMSLNVFLWPNAWFNIMILGHKVFLISVIILHSCSLKYQISSNFVIENVHDNDGCAFSERSFQRWQVHVTEKSVMLFVVSHGDYGGRYSGTTETEVIKRR